MPYNSLADVCHLRAELKDTVSNIKLGGFGSQFEVTFVSRHTEEL